MGKIASQPLPQTNIPIPPTEPDLAATAAEQNRWEFMLVAAPLAVETGTGSPVNALAIY